MTTHSRFPGPIMCHRRRATGENQSLTNIAMWRGAICIASLFAYCAGGCTVESSKNNSSVRRAPGVMNPKGRHFVRIGERVTMELLSIGEVAERLGRHTATLRRWERAGLLAPAFRLGGRRIYFAKDLARLAAIRDSWGQRAAAARRRTAA